MTEQTDPVSLGELGRRLDRFEGHVSRSLEHLSNTAVPTNLWAVEKRALEATLQGLGREIGELRGLASTMDVEKEGEHKELNTRITALKDALAAREAEVRKEKAQRYLAIGLAGLAAVFGIIGTVAATSLNAAITGGP